MARRRPNLNRAVEALLGDIVSRMPEFAHIDPARILVVAGEARRASRGSVKPLTFAGGRSRDGKGHRKAVVKLKGRRMLYCITLRPLFFRQSSARQRVETLVHELFHISPRFDGTLDEHHRHHRMGQRFGKRLKPIVRRYLRHCPDEVLQPFGHDGEVRIWQWLERPSAYFSASGKGRTVYTQQQLFLATVRMVTAPQPPKASPRRNRLH